MEVVKWIFLLSYLFEINCSLNESPDILDVVTDVFSTLDNLEQKIRHSKDIKNIGQERTFKNDLSENDFYLLSSQEDAGVFVLDGFTEKLIINSEYMKDLILFKHTVENKTKWYAVTLEMTPSNLTSRMVIYRIIQGEYYSKIVETFVHNDEVLYTYSLESSTYIVLVWNKKSDSEFHSSKIFLFDENEKLQDLQKINVKYATDVAIWKDMNEVFLAVAQESPDSSDRLTIYKWLGKHFDQIQTIDELKSRKVIPFKIGHIQYLAVASYRDDSGNTEVYSQVFKYDIHHGKFVYHQRILTHGAVDIKYFCFKQKHISEIFLVIANSHHLDLKGNKIYGTNSVIYKFVNDYFIPFQSIQLNHPEQWLPVVGIKGEFLLTVFSKIDGIKTYQYDGWKFIEVKTPQNSIFKNNVNTMRSYIHDDEPLIVIVYENDLISHIKPVFKKHDFIRHKEDLLYSWSKEMKDHLNHPEVKEIVHKYKPIEPLSITSTVPTIKKNDTNFHEQIERTILGDDIKFAQFRMDELENLLKESIIIEGDIVLNNLKIINNDTTFHNINTNSINAVDITGMLDEIFDLSTDFSLDDNFVFEDVEFENTIVPYSINNHGMDELYDLSKNINSLVVEGDVHVDDVHVGGTLDNIKMDKHSILLKSTDQNFNGYIHASKINADDFDSEYLNKNKMFEDNKFLSDVSSINTDNIIIKNINKINFPTIQKLVLQNLENQQIGSKYHFEKLVCKNFDSDGPVSDAIIPQNLIMIDNSNSVVQQDIIFDEPVDIRKMEITERLNHIPVHKKKLDVLLKNTTDKQYISGSLTFENLTLLGLVKLQGKINKGLDGIDPFLTIDEDFTALGDFKISGKVFIEKGLFFNDIHGRDGLSLNLVRNNGLRLDSELIENGMKFTSEITAENVKTNFINGVHYDSFVPSGAENEVISAQKTLNSAWFNDIVHIFSINGHDLLSFFKNSLQLNQNQIIDHHHHYNNISVNRILGKINVETHVEHFDPTPVQHSDDTTIIINTPCVVKHFQANNLHLKGNMNDINFDHVITDTVFNDKPSEIFCEKNFKKDLIFDQFNVKYVNKINMGDMQNGMEKWMNTNSINHIETIKHKINIGSLYSDHLFKGMAYEDFGKEWLVYRGDQTIRTHQNIDVLNVNNSLVLNDYKLYNLYHSMVRTDHEHFIENAVFSDTISSPSVHFHSTDSFDQNSLILSHNIQNKIISHPIKILKNLTVHGSFLTEGLISGLNPQILCDSLQSKTSRNKIHIKGTAHFKSPSNIRFINDIPLDVIINNTWNIHEDTYLPGYLHLNEMHTEDKFIVQGHVSNVNLQWLSKNYFSKSRDETIISKLYVKNDMVFNKNLNAHRLVNVPFINDINVERLITTSIRHGIQEIPIPLTFKESTITNHIETFSLINNLNLTNDVMRYDVKKNIFTSKSTISNLNVNYMFSPKILRIQNVDINYWLDNMVLINETDYIRSLKEFKKLSARTNIDCKGKLNSFLISDMHVLSRKDNQIITGMKIFTEAEDMFFKNLKIHGGLNHVNLDKLLAEQINKYGVNIIFTPMILTSLLTTSNINCRGKCRDGNIEELLNNFYSIEKLYEFEEEYKKLLDISHELLRQKQFSANYLNFYKTIQNIQEELTTVTPFSENHELLLTSKNKISSYIWDKNIGYFTYSPLNESCSIKTSLTNIDLDITPYFNPSIQKIYSDKCLYNLKFNCDATDVDQSIKSVESFYLHKLDQCCLLINDEKYINISCVDTKEHNKYEILNKEIVDVVQVEIITINDTPYLIILNQGYHEEQSHINIFKYDYSVNTFIYLQTFYINSGNVIDAICIKNFCFIAISTVINNPKVNGLIKILQYDSHEDIFVPIQEILTNVVKKMFFTKLPSGEILLYVVQDVSNISVYKYEGISGFGRMVDILEDDLLEFNQITFENQHFITGHDDYNLNIIKAFYKHG